MSIRILIPILCNATATSISSSQMDHLISLATISKESMQMLFVEIMKMVTGAKHPQSRLLAILIIEVFVKKFVILDRFVFIRSKWFRKLLFEDLNDFLNGTVGIEKINVRGAAKTVKYLRHEALRLLNQWNDEFGDDFKTVHLAYEHLKELFKELPSGLFHNEMRIQEEEKKEAFTTQLWRSKYLRVKLEYTSLMQALTFLFSEMEICLEILNPQTEETEIAFNKSIEENNPAFLSLQEKMRELLNVYDPQLRHNIMVTSNVNFYHLSSEERALSERNALIEKEAMENCLQKIELLQSQIAALSRKPEPIPEMTIAPVPKKVVHTDLLSFLNSSERNEKIEPIVDNTADLFDDEILVSNVESAELNQDFWVDSPENESVPVECNQPQAEEQLQVVGPTIQSFPVKQGLIRKVEGNINERLQKKMKRMNRKH